MTLALSIPTESLVHGGTSSIPSHGRPRPPAWRSHTTLGDRPSHLLPPLFTTPLLAATTQAFASKLLPPRSTASRRITLAKLTDGGEAAQGGGMLEAGGVGAGGDGESKGTEVFIRWRRRLGKIWAPVAERATPASPPTPVRGQVSRRLHLHRHPACRLELELWQSLVQRRK
jgi:hypothetical protein